jgi:ribose 5-phosphate isomerase B
MRVAIGSDHAGFNLKQVIVEHLTETLGAEQVLDLGPPSAARCDYPDYASKVADAILNAEAQFGVLICGTGIGISIAANKRAGVRAALCHDATTAGLARAHNDAQIVCFGARIVGEQVATDIVDAFLAGAFEGGRHVGRIAKIHTLEG